MAKIRFISPNKLDLYISGVPAVFVDGVCDIPEDQEERLARMRVLGSPYHIIELGQPVGVVNSVGLSEEEIAAAIKLSDTAIGQAITARLAPLDQLQTEVDDLRSEVNDLANAPGGGGSGIFTGLELPANLQTGALAARLRSY